MHNDVKIKYEKRVLLDTFLDEVLNKKFNEKEYFSKMISLFNSLPVSVLRKITIWSNYGCSLIFKEKDKISSDYCSYFDIEGNKYSFGGGNFKYYKHPEIFKKCNSFQLKKIPPKYLKDLKSKRTFLNILLFNDLIDLTDYSDDTYNFIKNNIITGLFEFSEPCSKSNKYQLKEEDLYEIVKNENFMSCKKVPLSGEYFIDQNVRALVKYQKNISSRIVYFLITNKKTEGVLRNTLKNNKKVKEKILNLSKDNPELELLLRIN